MVIPEQRQGCNFPMIGKTKCKYHGGASPGGTLSGLFKTGRHSKYLPTRLLENYHASLADQNILELNHEIALLDARVSELLDRVQAGESGQLWFELRATFERFVQAQYAITMLPAGDEKR